MRAAAWTIGLALCFALAGGGCAGDGSASFCDLAARFEADMVASADAADLEDRFTAALDTLDRLVEAAPDDIVGDVATVRDDLESFARGTGELGSRFEAASRRVSEYLGRECDASDPGPTRR